MYLTDRDVQILEWVEKCRFLTREQIQRVLFTSRAASACKRRLTALYHNGYLGRLLLPVPAAYGASQAVYYLDQRGAAVLSRSVLAGSDVNWRRRDHEREELFLAHTLDINDVRIAFSLACRSRGLALEWFDERSLRRLAIVERVKAANHETITLLPDAYFTITTSASTDGFALEVDRATVPERRMRARIRAYGEWAASGSYRRKLPAQSLRVLFAVTDRRRDPRRLDRLKAWCEEERGRSLFWFVDRAGLEGDVLEDPVWLMASENEARRLPLSSDLR